MNIVPLIAHKRDGGELTTAEIAYFIDGVTNDSIPDYQIAAMLMAIYLRGMSRRETVDLTLAIANSGDTLDLHDVADFVVDKHSSGGVGDKTTLVVQPVVASLGVPVGKMSGRGLGMSGGTLDKMESFSSWRFDMPLTQFKKQLADIGIVLAGQSANLAPADGKLYALRDVTATVASIPLIAASIMSKKLAAGADAIVLDVKVGSGAFMRDVESARQLARVMVDIGNDAGRQTVALLSDMNQPLGNAIGNALEVKEAIDTLRNSPSAPPDFVAHCQRVAAHMLVLAKKYEDVTAAKSAIKQAINSGAALDTFKRMVAAQGGDLAHVDSYELLPSASVEMPILAPQSGTIAAIDTGAIGWAAVELGGGRKTKADQLDYGVGFQLQTKIAASFKQGDVLGTVFAKHAQDARTAAQTVLSALRWTDAPFEYESIAEVIR